MVQVLEEDEEEVEVEVEGGGEEEDSCVVFPVNPKWDVKTKTKKHKKKTCKTAQDQEVARLTLSIVFIRYL